MNAPPDSPPKQWATVRIVTLEQRATVLDEIREMESYLAGVRGELDDLWGAARDATEGSPLLTTETNRSVADGAAFQALQMLRVIERHLENLGRVL